MGASVSQDPESRRSGVENYVYQGKESAQTELPGLGPINLTPGLNRRTYSTLPCGRVPAHRTGAAAGDIIMGSRETSQPGGSHVGEEGGGFVEEVWRTGIRGTEGLQRRHRAPTVQLSRCRPPMSEATLSKGKHTAFRVGPPRLPYRLYDLQVPPRLKASFLISTWGAGTHLTELPRGGLAVEARMCSWSGQHLAQPSVPESITLCRHSAPQSRQVTVPCGAGRASPGRETEGAAEHTRGNPARGQPLPLSQDDS